MARLIALGLAFVLTWAGQALVSGQGQQPVQPADRIAQLRAKIADLETKTGPDDPAVASALNELAGVYYAQFDYAAAEPLLRRALRIRQTALGPDDTLTAQAANNLAQVLQERGNYVEAEPLLERALHVYEKNRGPEHADVAIALNNLAGLYRVMGNYARAEPLYLRALAIREKIAGPDDATVAVALNNLGLMYQQAGDLKKARAPLERSLQIRERMLGPDNPDVGRALNNLAVLSQEEGNLAAAEGLYRRAISNYEAAFGRANPQVGQALNNLAVVYLLEGQYDKAGPLYDEAIQIRRNALGPRHPDMARALTSQAIYYDVTGRLDEAVKRQTESTEVTDRNLALILATGSETQKQRYMETFTEDTDITVSMHRVSGPANDAAARLALTTILRRKGRVLDAMSGTLQTLRDRMKDDDRAALDRLSATRTALATMVLRGPGRQDAKVFADEVHSLEEEIQRDERDVSARSAAYRAQAASVDVTIDSVRGAMPDGSALVEIVLYRPFNNRVPERDKRFSAPRYAAYVLTSSGQLKSVELGEAAGVDAQVDALRRRLRDPKSAGLRTSARALYDTIVAPLQPLLGGATRLLVSPDGALNLVPFAALVGRDGRYLLESADVSYLTSGRDLLRLQERAASSTAPLILGDPKFDAAATAGASAADGGRAIDLSRARFTPLPGTAAEAAALRALLPQADVRTGSNATEAAVKQAHGPLLLHLATHGFFLGSEQTGSTESGRMLVHAPSPPAITYTAGDNPLLRSGLAFAGANQRQGGAGDDGILTALEAASLDLWGTRMAVLSACETGVGETKRGDGVYGLRRSLVMAGAESQVMSLWQVSDAATRALMTAFYTKLKAGGARSAALREVQLDMLRSANRAHPYYWASFILSGADGPIDLH